MATAMKVRERRDVEDLLIWAMVDNGLGGQIVERRGRIGWTELGTIVDGGRGGWEISGPRVQHDDAYAIANTVLALPPDPVTGEATMAELVIRHARTNCRPDWCEEGVGRAVPKVNKRGQVEYDYERPGDRKSRKLEAKMVWKGETQAAVDFYRARYALWWIALKTLVAPLNAAMTRFEATGPRAPEEPWAGVRVYGPDGAVLTGMHGEDSSVRLARLAARGPLELSPEAAPGNIHVGESAA